MVVNCLRGGYGTEPPDRTPQENTLDLCVSTSFQTEQTDKKEGHYLETNNQKQNTVEEERDGERKEGGI